MTNRLNTRNVTVNGRRTSLRLEGAIWDALVDICAREKLTLHQVCSLIDQRRDGTSRTSAVRAFVVTYFRMATTDDGHAKAGHGSLAVDFGLPPDAGGYGLE